MTALYHQYFWTWFILIYFRYLLWDKMNCMWSAWLSQLTVKVVQWIGSEAEEYPKFSTWLPFLLDVLLTSALPPLANSTGTPSVPDKIVWDVLLMAGGCGAWPLRPVLTKNTHWDCGHCILLSTSLVWEPTKEVQSSCLLHLAAFQLFWPSSVCKCWGLNMVLHVVH